MFGPDIKKVELQDLIDAMNEEDFARFLYCQHIISTFLAVGQFERMLITAMKTSDRVKIRKVLRDDLDQWDLALQKVQVLEASTLGSLITILDRHDVNRDDISYLKWIKGKRDYFIHRLLHDGGWPGDLDVASCRLLVRRLLALQLWLERGNRRIWSIFERAGFVELDHLEDGGILAMNTGVYDVLTSNEQRVGTYKSSPPHVRVRS